MNHHRSRGRGLLGRRPVFCASILLLGLSACGGSSDNGSGFISPTNPGEAVMDPATGRFFFVDPNDAGLSQSPRVLRQAWGRLVRVNGLDDQGATVEMNTDFVIAQDLVSTVDYDLFTNPVTNEQVLTILRDVTDTSAGGGREQFFDLLRGAEANLAPIFDNGLLGVGFFTMVPRNAAMVVQLDDLVAASSVDPTTVRTVTGIPTVLPYEGRVLVDANHGDLADFDNDGQGEFHSTRVIVDTTVSELESFGADPPLPVNPTGLPPSLDQNQSNLQVRIPTLVNVNLGQEIVLTNPSGHVLTTSNNGTVDYSSPTLDVVRAMRSGGTGGTTQDPNNGFLRDEVPPSVVGSQQITVDTAPVPLPGDGQDFLLPSLTFQSLFCSQTPVEGDILAQTGVFAVVTGTTTPVSNGTVENVRVRLLVWPPLWDQTNGPLQWATAGVGPSEFLSAWDPAADDGAQSCFVRVFPLSNGYPEEPTERIFTSSTLGVRFSEPMDGASVTAFDSMLLTRQATPASSTDYVVGAIQDSQTADLFTFIPDLPLAHESGGAEPYFFTLSPTPQFSTTDLAGNSLGGSLPTVEATIEPTAAPQANGGRVSRFTSADEDPPFAAPGDPPLSEWGGQHTYNLTEQHIRPRPVSRFQALADRSQAIINIMPSNMTGLQSPVSSFGSKTHFLWRYVDVGFDLTTAADYNLDVEGLDWAPFGGSVVVDGYSAFEMRLSHAYFLPDEAGYSNSGLAEVYADNFMNAVEDPQRVVHHRALGYTIHPGDIFIVGQNVSMIPFPLNRNVAPSERIYYTWRDTALQSRAGPDGFGAPPAAWFGAMGLPTPITGDCLGMPDPNPFYDPDQIQSVGLSLLMEFRCYPENGANGINRFDASVASGGGPFFRAFSEGGIDTSNNHILVEPDLETQANGGYDPLSMPVPGATTPGRDGNLYIGAMDLVVRVSRSYTLWMQTTNPLGSPAVFVNPNYGGATVEPPATLPFGTAIEVAFRGATLINAGSEPLQNALELDAYGDHYTEIPSPCDGSIDHNPDTLNTDISFLGNDQRWFEDITALDGAQYYQARVTFISNTASGQGPWLSAFAVTWKE